MEKYINSLIRGFKKVFNKKYFAVVSVFIGIVTVLGFSYGYLATESGWKLATQLTISKLYYSFSVNNVSTNEIIVAANSGTTYYNVEITSLNDINTRYALAYKVSGDATVKVSSASTNSGSGIIGVYSTGTNAEKKKTIRIAVTNSSANVVVVSLAVAGGYAWNPENEVSVPSGYSIISGIANEYTAGIGLTLAQEIDLILGCTPTASVPCYYTNNANNYLSLDGYTWRIIGTYLVDSKPVVKAILDEPLTSRVTYANVSSALTTFYNGLSDKTLIQGTATSLTKAEYDTIGGVNSYLYTKPDNDYWTGTQYYVGTSRGAVNKSSTYTAYVRPVVTLKTDVVNTATGEAGTYSNPYTVEKGMKVTIDGLTYGTTNLQTGYYVEGRTYTLNTPVSTNANFAFSHWNISDNDTSINGTSLTIGSEWETTITAIWAAKMTYVAGASSPREVRIGNEEFYVLNDILNYTTLGNTNGNIYNYSSGKTVLLAKNNLYVGRNCTTSSACTVISSSDPKYGLQSTEAIGNPGSYPSTAVVPFAGSSSTNGYWYTGSGLNSIYGSAYDKSNVYDASHNTAPNYSVAFQSNAGNANYSVAYYVEEYVNRLGINGVGRLLTYSEAYAMTTDQRNNGTRYWLGSAYSSTSVRNVTPQGGFANYVFRVAVNNAVRPVIVVDTADIKLPFVSAGTDLATGLPVVRSNSIPTEEFLNLTTAINYSTLTSTYGDLFNYASGKSILLAKYNLYVGQNCTSLSSSSCTPISTSDSRYGLQSEDAKGLISSSSTAVVPFAGTGNSYAYWYDSTNSTIYTKYGTTYYANNIYDTNYVTAPNYSVAFYNNAGNANYSIAYYVEEYVNRLGINGTGRLLTYPEASGLQTIQRGNGAYYWLGTAKDDDNVWATGSGGYDDYAFPENTNVRGVRPVIVVSSSGIEATR